MTTIVRVWLLGLAIVVLVVGVGIVRGQEPSFAVDASCAMWLQGVAREKADPVGYDSGYMIGYAAGVMSAANALPVRRVARSSLKNVGELVTGITSLCAASPQKRLIDVALHLLGYR